MTVRKRSARDAPATWIDHVLVVVDDLQRAAERLFERYGLASVPGGRHVGQGTANRIVPLGRDYVELIGVVDEEEARSSALGRWVASRRGGDGGPAAWCVAVDDLDPVCERLGFPAVYMERARPDGRTLSWRLAGMEAALAEPPLPFFISWLSAADLHPGRSTARHRVIPQGIRRIELTGDRTRVGEWLGPHELPISVAAGPPGVTSVSVATDEGDVVLR
jgi:hypothetical protein